MLTGEGVYTFAPVNYGVTGENLTKFTDDVGRSSRMNTFKSEVRYFNPFWNARAMNKGE